jgi:hypothetical protein
VELLVYTLAEWQRLMTSSERFAQILKSEMQWILPLHEQITLIVFGECRWSQNRDNQQQLSFKSF